MTLHPHENLWSVRLNVHDLRAGSNGKGTSELLATASAYAEFAERLSAGMEVGINVGPYRQLYGHRGDIIDDVTLFRYVKGYRWLHQDNFISAVRAEDMLKEHTFTKAQLEHLKLNSELMRHWIPGYSLVHNCEVMVPILFIKWLSATNGIASANTIEEAIIHAACEVFERDALIKFVRRMNSDKSPTVDLTTINDPIINNIVGFFESNNVEVVVKDIGNGIYPVYAAMTFTHNLPKNHAGYNTIKAGSSFSPVDAVTRCLTERMQGTTFKMEESVGLTTEEMAKDQYLPLFFRGICPMDLSSLKDGPVIPFNSTPFESTKMEIEECVNIAKKLSTDLVVIDHTHPLLNFPTVRVVMPGISDFMKWWDPTKISIDFLGNIRPDEDRYEKHLLRVLRTFKEPSSNSTAAKNESRRDK